MSEKLHAEEKREKKQGGSEDWRPHHEKLMEQMMKERLHDAIKGSDINFLKKAISDYKSNTGQDNDKDEEVKRAERKIEILTSKENLKEAMEYDDVEAMKTEIDNIKSKGFHKYLQYEVREAEYKIDAIERLKKSKYNILDMDQYTMSEIRRYNRPPQVVKSVIQAALLLLGEDELTTGDWAKCLKLCNPRGPNGLHRRVLNFDGEGLHPQIRQRAKEILSQYELSQVQKVSTGAGTFYVWAMGVIQDSEDRTENEDGNKKIKPANIETQRKILGRA